MTLTFTAEEAESCDLTFNIDPPKSVCVSDPSPGATCTETYTPGTDVRIASETSLSAEGCAEEVCWSGACFGTPTTLGSVCTLTMDTDKVAGGRYTFGSCAASVGPPVSLAWNLDLDVPGAIGQAVVDGQLVVAASGRRAQQMARSRQGEVVVAAHLVRGEGKPGTWRFEAQQSESIEPGSLRVLQGNVALLTPTAVVFRLKGYAGEQVGFSYRLRR